MSGVVAGVTGSGGGVLVLLAGTAIGAVGSREVIRTEAKSGLLLKYL